MSRVPQTKVVDTRKATNVNLDKYDEKLQDMAELSLIHICAMAQLGYDRQAALQLLPEKARQLEDVAPRRAVEHLSLIHI